MHAREPRRGTGSRNGHERGQVMRSAWGLLHPTEFRAKRSGLTVVAPLDSHDVRVFLKSPPLLPILTLVAVSIDPRRKVS